MRKIQASVCAFQQKEDEKNMGPQLTGPGDVVTGLPREVTLIISAFSVCVFFFPGKFCPCLSSASESSGRVLGICRVSDSGGRLSLTALKPTGNTQVQGARRAAPELGSDRSLCEAALCHVQKGSQ